MKLSLREVLGISKKEFHFSIIDLVKRKRLSMELEPEPEKLVEVKASHIEEVATGRMILPITITWSHTR